MIDVADTNVKTAFSCNSRIVKAPQLHIVDLTFARVTPTLSFNLPGALIIGPNLYPIVSSSILPFILAILINSCIPNVNSSLLLFIMSNPFLTIMWFSSTSGTTSAIVANAAYTLQILSFLLSVNICSAILYTMPAPQ